MSSDQPTEHSNGQLADELIAHCRGDDGNAMGYFVGEESYTGKLDYLWDTWEMTKALVAIAAWDASLLRPLFAPLLRELETTLRRAMDSLGDMEAIEPPQDEITHACLEWGLFDALKLIRALEEIQASSGTRSFSLFAPLLRELETTLRSALDTINALDRPVAYGPVAIPPGRDGHAASQPVANDHAPEAPADLSKLVTATPSGNATAATNGRTSEAPAKLTPPARAVAAAYDLQREGKPISLKAACERAGVDRKNLRELHPEAARTIAALAAPDRTPRRAIRDPRTRNLDALDETED